MTTQIHLDANESVFFARQLESIKSKTYDKKYADLKARTLIPVSNEADPFCESITYAQFDMVGMAKLVHSYADDVPESDVKGAEFTHPVKSLASAFSYNIMEMRQSMARGKDLPQRKANAAKRAILQKENSLAMLGDSTIGLKGFLNHPNMPQATIAADGTGATTTFSTKTPAQILRDLHVLANAVPNQSFFVETADTVLLPRAQYLYIASTPWATNNDARTILEVFMQQAVHIKNVDWVNELSTAGASGVARGIAYRRDPEALTLEIPQDIEILPPQAVNMAQKSIMHSRFGGVIVYYPLSMAFIDGI